MPEPIANAAAQPQEVDLSGRKIGDFQVLRRLGRGAMAEVYLAEQGSLRRQVALKVLRSNLSSDTTYIQRFHNEAQAAASLVHGNIVQIYDVGCIDGVHYISQEYVQGQNLREYLSRHGPPAARLAVLVMRQVASALVKAGETGIIHRDVKPENIMLTRDGDVKVADFGLARLSGNSGVNLTQVGITMGTPLYMSPEQVEGRALDPRSDIYSFGVTSYHMLAGFPPFQGETALSVAVQHLKSTPKPLDELRADLPAPLCRIVDKMLAKDPADRYATARDLLRDLRSIPIGDGDDAPLSESAAAHDANLLSAAVRSTATDRLDDLMKTSAMVAVRRRQGARMLVGGVVAAFMLGMLFSWASREPSLLADARSPDVPMRATPREQFEEAQLKLNEDEREAWYKSLTVHFADDTFFTPRAKEELALLYLQRDQNEEAMSLFRDLASPLQTEKRFNATGLAGQAFLLAQSGDLTEAARIFTELTKIRNELPPDPRINQLADDAQNRIRRELDASVSETWDQWRESNESDDAPGES